MRRRTYEEKEENRQRMLTVLENATGWVPAGYVRKRLSDPPKIGVMRKDLRRMVDGGTLECVGKGGAGNPYRYAITGRFQQEQRITERPSGRSCAECGVTSTVQWRGELCNACGVRKYKAAAKKTRMANSTANNKRAWLPAEEQQLIDEVLTHDNPQKVLADIAQAHGRTVNAIGARLYKLSREGRIEWGTRTGTSKTTPAQTLHSRAREAAPISDDGSIASQVAGIETLRSVVAQYLAGNKTLNELQDAYYNAGGAPWKVRE